MNKLIKNITINEDSLCIYDIREFSSKVRGILVKDNKLLVANYGGVYLLPGGTIEKNESKEDAIIRELKEETGINYRNIDLEQILTLVYYQKDYPTKSNYLVNRLLVTHYYIGEYQGIDNNHTNRTDKEIRDGFSLRMIDINNLDTLIKEESNNPRKAFFDRELGEVSKILRKTNLHY